MEVTKEAQGEKRKRSPENSGNHGPGRIPQAPRLSERLSENATITAAAQINYLVRARSDRLKLIKGDSETFGDILSMIDEYEGMLMVPRALVPAPRVNGGSGGGNFICRWEPLGK